MPAARLEPHLGNLVSTSRLTRTSREGELVYSVVREIARVATEKTETDWIAAARGKTAHEMQRMISGRVRGDSPTTPKKPEAEVRRVSHDLDAGAYALLREAKRVAVKAAGESLDASAFIATLCRTYLAAQAGEGKRDPGRASYQIALIQCEDCGRAELQAGGSPVTATTNDVARAHCTVFSSCRQRLGRVDGEEAPRATQDIPPKTRRMVSARQSGCCAVPGCENTVFLDIHHVDPRSEGGTHEPGRLVMLCEHHHRAAHTCALLIDGTNGQGFTFRHADGTRYGSPEVGARISDLMTQAFETLTAMGYRHREARGILDGVRAQVCATSTLSEVVRAALKAAPAPMCVRESVAVYQRVA